MSEPVNVVVAGLGRAGKARVRDITTNILGENLVVLKGVISRHKPENITVPFLSWDEALASKDVDAIIICTENCEHEEYVRKCLKAGKHVLVDFPMTLNSNATKKLIELADENGLILQEEDISLLTDAFNELKDILSSKPRVVKASMNFCASLSTTAWVCDFKRGGFPSFSGINRLHMVYELFGEMSVKSATMTVDDNKREMIVNFLAGEVPMLWTETRVSDSSRAFSFNFTFEDQSTFDYSPRMGPPPRTAPPDPNGPPRGLFARDLKLFLQKIRGEIPLSEIEREKKRTLHCSEIAGKMEEISTQQ